MRTVKLLVEVKINDNDYNKSFVRKIVKSAITRGLETVDEVNDSIVEEAVDSIISIKTKVV